MARKSKFVAEVPDATTKWKIAIYLRLSREDGDKVESDSISSQREMIETYLKSTEAQDTYTTDCYVDDGWSGTNFDRPAFKRMLDDIKRDNINCVVVKDLSRLGRNYIEVGHYLEVLFPMLDIRFIAINDRIDSVADPESINSAIVPFKNVLNDEYCRDISNKIRSSLTIKRKSGKFIGSFASYGYMKDPENHNRLIVDPEAAPVVKDIFEWFLSGLGVITIAKKLNQLGVLNPSAYKRSKGYNYRNPHHEVNDTLWPDSSVRRILRNRLYAGDMVQGKNKTKSYKVQKCVNIPEENWIIVENTHEAIIDRDTFEKVQSLFNRDTRTSPAKNRVYTLSGFIRCADCRRAMNRKLISQPYAEYCYYVCSTYKKMNVGACSKHTIRSDKLDTAVLETIKSQISIAIKYEEVLAKLKQKNIEAKNSHRLESRLKEKEIELTKIANNKIELYPDWKEGIITKEEYLLMKERFNAQEAKVRDEIEGIRSEIEKYKAVMTEENSFVSHFVKHRNVSHLTREMVVELIDMIYVHEGGAITIKFKYQDEYERLLDLLNEQKISIEYAS